MKSWFLNWEALLQLCQFCLDFQHYSLQDGVCIFHVKGYETSSWDWIGLYRVSTLRKDFKEIRK